MSYHLADKFTHSLFFLMARNIVFAILTCALILGVFSCRQPESQSSNRQDVFRRSLNELEEHVKTTLKKAKTFDQNTVLQRLPKSSWNGNYYRFDDHLSDAVVDIDSTRIESDPYHRRELFFEFDGEDPIAIGASASHTYKDDLLQFVGGKNAVFFTQGSLDVRQGQISEIEVRIRAGLSDKPNSRWKTLEIGWSKDRLKNIPTDFTWKSGRSLQLNILADNQFHSYRMKVKGKVFTSLQKDRIRTLFWRVLGSSDKLIEIDFLRFHSRDKEYSSRLFGTTYESLNKEMRPGIFVSGPGSLKYRLSIPSNKPKISFELGKLQERGAASLSITLRSKEGQAVLFSREILRPDKWTDFVVSLEKWAGRTVDLSFDIEMEPNDTLLIANPIMIGASPDRLNVILVVEDTLRADHMSAYGYRRKTTPVKDNFAEQGALFNFSFSTATKTWIACTSMMTSLHPSAHGTWSIGEQLPSRYLTLAEVMRSQGFTTAAFLQNYQAGHLVGLHQGFSYLFEPNRMGGRAVRAYGAPVLNWIRNHKDSNFFLYLHLLNPHGRYEPELQFRHWYKREGPGETGVKADYVRHDASWVKNPTAEGRRLLYDGEISENDHYFQNLLNQIDELGLTNNTLIVFTSDHGEHLGERKIWEHSPPGYIQVLRVPLIMKYPAAISAGRRITAPVQLVDVMPTILDLAKVPLDSLMTHGLSLKPLLTTSTSNDWNSRSVFVDEAMSYDGNKFSSSTWGSLFFDTYHVLKSPNVKGLKVFDYRKDPQEFNPITNDIDSLESKSLESMIKIKRINQEVLKLMTKDTEEGLVQTPEALEHLKTLGYIQ